MKKIFAVLAIMLSFGFAFAMDEFEDESESGSVDMSVQVITPENPHTENKTAQVTIEYLPGIHEARFYYTCLAVSRDFDESEARESIRQCATDFQLENNYFSYKYLGNDRLSYKKNSRGLREATYMSQIKFIDKTRNQL